MDPRVEWMLDRVRSDLSGVTAESIEELLTHQEYVHSILSIFEPTENASDVELCVTFVAREADTLGGVSTAVADSVSSTSTSSHRGRTARPSNSPEAGANRGAARRRMATVVQRVHVMTTPLQNSNVVNSNYHAMDHTRCLSFVRISATPLTAEEAKDWRTNMTNPIHTLFETTSMQVPSLQTFHLLLTRVFQPIVSGIETLSSRRKNLSTGGGPHADGSEAAAVAGRDRPPPVSPTGESDGADGGGADGAAEGDGSGGGSHAPAAAAMTHGISGHRHLYSEILSWVNRLDTQLRGFSSQVSAERQLPMAQNLMNLNCGDSEIKAVLANDDLVRQVNLTVTQWQSEISYAMALDPQKEGPLGEIEYWREKYSTISALYEQINSPQAKFVLLIAKAADCESSAIISTTLQQFYHQYAEAKDNVKFLGTLDRHFRIIQNLDAKSATTLQPIIDTLSSMMMALRMVWIISRFYSTEERMAGLLEKIAQLIAQKVSYFVDFRSILSLPTAEAKAKVTEGQQCLLKWKSAYTNVQEEINSTEREQHWNFDTRRLFGTTDYMSERCTDLLEIIETVEYYVSVLGGQLKTILTDTSDIERILSNVEKLKRPFETLTFDPFEKKAIHNWQVVFSNFISNVGTLDLKVSHFIKNIFDDDLRSAESAFELLLSFKNIENRPERAGNSFDISALLSEKADRILAQYYNEVENVRNIFLEYRDEPPLTKNQPPVAGSIHWCMSLFQRLKHPIVRFQNENILNTPMGRKVRAKYVEVARQMKDYATARFLRWRDEIHVTATTSLKINIIRQDAKGIYVVNFDNKVFDMIREAKYLDRLGFDIPQEALHIALQHEAYHGYVDALKAMLLNFNYELGILNGSERAILAQNIRELKMALEPGFHDINWTSLSIPDFVQNCDKAITKFRNLSREVRKSADSIQTQVVNKIATTRFTPDYKDIMQAGGELPELPTFVEIVEQRRSELLERCLRAYRTAKPLLTKVESQLFGTHTGKSAELASYYAYWEHRIWRALIKMVLLSLAGFAKLLGYATSRRPTARPPLFKVVIFLTTEPAHTPQQQEILTAFHKIQLSFIESTRMFPRWMRGTCIEFTHGEIIPRPMEGDHSTLFSFYQDIYNLPQVYRLQAVINRTIQTHLSALATNIKSLQRYRFVYLADKKISVEQQAKSQLHWIDYDAKFQLYFNMINDFDADNHVHNFGFMRCDETPFYAEIVEHVYQWIAMEGAQLNDTLRVRMNKRLARIRAIHNDLTRPCDNIDDLKFVLEVMHTAKETALETEQDIDEINYVYDSLRHFGVALDPAELAQALSLRDVWSCVLARVHQTSLDLEPRKLQFRTLTQDEVTRFAAECERTRAAFRSNGPSRRDIDLAEGETLRKEWRKRVSELQLRRDQLTKAEKLFDLPLTSHTTLQELNEELGRVEVVYDLYHQWSSALRRWNRSSWKDLLLEDLEKTTDERIRQARMLGKQYRQVEPFAAVEQTILDFHSSLPLLMQLKSPALKARHWEELMRVTGTKFNYEQINLDDLIAMQLFHFSDEIDAIVVAAAREQGVEQEIRSIQDYWGSKDFVLVRFEPRPGQLRCHVLADVSDIQEAVDDHMLKMRSIANVRWAQPFIDDVRLWERRLSMINDVIAVWVTVQQKWQYLESIFKGNEDMAQQLPKETARFVDLDKKFVRIMNDTAAAPNVNNACNANGRLEELRFLEARLEECQKDLSNYLETKRFMFPRFYFISDEELLSILASSSAKAVQNHMLKMFDNCARLLFKCEMDETVFGVESQEGEQLYFATPVKTEGRPVEEWLQSVLRESQVTLHDILKATVFYYPKMRRLAWLQKYHGMLTLTGAKIFWTFEIEDAFAQMRKGVKNAVKQLSSQLTAQLFDLVGEMDKDIDSQYRKKINTLIIVDVHGRDIVDRFVRDSVMDPADFDWESQLRFYWQRDGDTCVIRQCTGTFRYGFEYMGLNGRLVITPLTDRCFMTLTQALTFHLGGAPGGPAGTGKTESVKDLAKAMAIQCVVFNCGEGLDYKAMGSIFAGLSQSGSWGCFDEFNRIELPVLSVVSEQLRSIQSALQTGAQEFVFTNTVIRLVPTVGVFITMNPGYAGRVELPDNLKALFRPVVMVVPDMELIAENMLFSEGFTTARELAKKMVTLYALAHGQLTKQHHYDWGLRALKAVLVMAGQLKRGSPELSEESVLMRALRDMNAPKFIAEDEPLFRGLMEDLFPGLDPTRVPQENLARASAKVLRERGLQVEARQVDKVVQLYETMQTRHTTMVVGPTGGGKTVVIDTLCRAQTELGLTTKSYVINPKAQPTSVLYGVLDPMTRNWTDGIFSNIFRAMNQPGGGDDGGGHMRRERRYVIFDGDVDAKWVEDMNSVMDDNKLLTLPNGERIRLHPSCSLLFEVGDLQYASPATVSRVGMVFLDPVNLGWRPFMQTWKLSRPRDEHETLDDLVDQFVQPLLNFVLDGVVPSGNAQAPPNNNNNNNLGRRDRGAQEEGATAVPLRLVIPTNALNMVKQLTMMVHTITPKDTALEPRTLQCVFIFACVWSFGALVSTQEDRARFDQFLKQITGWNLQDVGENFLTRFVGSGSLPLRKTLYDYFFDLRDSRWKPWNVLIRPFTRPPGTPFSALLVSTVDTECHMWLLDKVVRNRSPAMFVGESGTAKTVTIQSYLQMLKQQSMRRDEAQHESNTNTNTSTVNRRRGASANVSANASPSHRVTGRTPSLTPGSTTPRRSVLALAEADEEVELEEMLLEINFSSRTTSLDAQRAMEDNIEKRTNTVLGPPPKKRLVVFVDDVNMPKVDLYGTQQPIAFLKLLMEHHAWYDRRDLLFKHIRDTQFVAAMAPPGGGRNPLDPRFVSLFTVFNILFPHDESVQTIYRHILRDAYHRVGPHAESLTDTLTDMTLRLYRSLVTALPATPAKFHYIFNLRDLSRVYEGLCRASAEKFDSVTSVVRLWRNEMTRVFVDRMSDTADKAWVQEHMRKEVQRYFVDEAAAVLQDPLLFGDFGDFEPFREASERAAHPPRYEDLGPDYDRTRALVESMMEEINTPVRRMDLVMFDMALEHLLRIARVLALPRGHCLLVGVGGSGKQSLTRLAAAMGEMGVFELTLSRNYGEDALREDLKKLYHRVGVQQEKTVFLFMDGHVKQEGFLELIHNMLASGMVPALFSEEEKEPLYASVTEELERCQLAPSKDNAWLIFVRRCRDYLHVVLSMSPSGDTLRNRCRNFPSLINNTTIDWFEKWPAQALRAVGSKVLAEESVPEELRAALVEHAVHVHLTADHLSARYQAEMKRHNYVTPKNFLGYLANYAKLLRRHRDHVDDVVHKFTIGLEKLQLAQNEVKVLQEELAEKEVTLREKQAINARMTREIEAQKSKNEERKVAALAMEEELHVQRAEIETESAEAQVVLDQAMPALEEAMEAVKHINPKSITELRSFAKPPVSVVAVVRMVCVVKGVTPTWEAGKIMMSQSDFIRSLIDIDTLTPTLNQAKMNEINKLLREFAINSNDLKKVSVAASGLMIWVEAMKQYWNVAKEVFPKQERVKQLQVAQERAESQLLDCRREIDELTESLRRLERELHAGQQEARQLTQEKAVMERRLNAARRLLDGFVSERSRWTAETTALAASRRRLVGDCLAGAAFLSYLGAFTFPYREEAMQRWWLTDLRDKGVPLTQPFDIRRLLADEVTIAQWASDGLPSDELSVQNGILTTMSTDNGVTTTTTTTATATTTAATGGGMTDGSQTPPPAPVPHKNKNGAAAGAAGGTNYHPAAGGSGSSSKRLGKVRFPLCIDPQMQAVSWIKRRHQDNPRFEVASFADADFLKRLEFAIQYGNPFLFEGVDEFIDPIIDPVLDPQFKTESGQRIIRVGDKDIPWDDNFRLYLCTKLPNPNYPAEVFGKTMVINYGVTQDGLEAQLLNYVVASERGDLQRQSEELVRTMAESRAQLKELEDTLIRELTLSTGNILDNDDLVTTLENTKSSASAVQQKLDEARRTAAITELSRQQYRPAAQRGAVLYFLIAQLSTVNAMYEYSLSAFLHDVFAYSITKSDASFDIADRLRNIIHAVTYNLYAYVCMGIFERDKLMLSFQMAIRLLTQHGRMVPSELAFFLRGCVLASRSFPPKPVCWLTERQWNDVCELARQVPVFAGLPESVRTQPEAWQAWFALDRPEEVSQAERLLPVPYGRDVAASDDNNNPSSSTSEEKKESATAEDEEGSGSGSDSTATGGRGGVGGGGGSGGLTEFQRLCLLRCFRADRVYTAVSNFITHCDLLGEAYVMPPILRYKDVLMKSSSVSPIVCIVSPGANPTDEIVKLAAKEVGLDKLHCISLGQGQGEEAMRMVEVGAVRGHWVLLQNCHLLTAWMKELEKTTEHMITQQQPPHEQFRLWLTTEPSAEFPMGILQRSLKVVNEPPNGLKMNMKNTLSKVAEEQLESCPHWAFRPLVFTLAFFHAVVQERRKYGKMGWNVVYDFNETDFTISMRLLNTYLTKAHVSQSAIPWETLRYLVGEAMYGGRVTDSMDRRIVKTYLEEYFGDFLFDTFRPFHFFVDADVDYSLPPGSADATRRVTLNQMLAHVERFPNTNTPDVFGLHPNAETGYLRQATENLWASLVELMPRSGEATATGPPVASTTGVSAGSPASPASPAEMGGGGSGSTEAPPTTPSSSSPTTSTAPALTNHSRDAQLMRLIEDIVAQIPPPFDLKQTMQQQRERAAAAGQTSIQPTQVVLMQELERWNLLIQTMTASLVELQKALAGVVGMSGELDELASALSNGQLPHSWRRRAPATRKSLGRWLAHFEQRYAQYRAWCDHGEPRSVWLSGLMVPESYLSALVQVTCRKYGWPLDRSTIVTTVTSFASPAEVRERPEDGAYVHGLFLEGARWDARRRELAPQRKKELTSPMPVIHIVPTESSRVRSVATYKTPVYVTSDRRNAAGVGLVFMADLANGAHPSLWTLESVALILDSDD